MPSLLQSESSHLFASNFGVAAPPPAQCAATNRRGIHLLYAPLLRHVTHCCINRFRLSSRITMSG